jgi:hypothetical protein
MTLTFTALPTFLIDTLYYNIHHVQQLPFAPNKAITVTHLADPLSKVDPTSMITFLGYRLPHALNETITLRNAAGTLTATATYADAGLTFETSTASATYTVLHGTGRYAHATYIIVFFNKTRVVKIFSEKNITA